jgi:sporulation protein YqfC
MKKAGKLLERISRRLDLPADEAAGVPRISLTGDRECSIEGECAILEYEKTGITVSAAGGSVTIRGSGLEVRIMHRGRLTVAGKVEAVILGGGPD